MNTKTGKRPAYGDPEVRRLAATLLAPEVAEWGIENDDQLIEDLMEAWDSDGYRFARRLEDAIGLAMDAEMVEVLDAASSHQWKAHKELCAQWVRENRITTDLKVGDKVRILDHKLGLDSLDRFETEWIGEIVEIDRIHAEATVFLPAAGHVRNGCGSRGRILPWEGLQREKKVLLAMNLATGAELFFSGDVSPKWAAAYGHCDETDRLSWLFSKRKDGGVDAALAELPIKVGERSVNCGDWAAMPVST